MKILFLILFFICSLFADTKKVYFYTTQSNINNFKSLKVNFDTYLQKFGKYEFQAFSDQESFELYLKDKNIIVILSSWHYLRIAKKYEIEAKLVAQKRDSITDTKVLIGKKGAKLGGMVTSAYTTKHTNSLLDRLVKDNKLSVVKVPKEIDALMSVGFGMSQFALVSQDSFKLLQEINGFLAKDLEIYKESQQYYRMLVASKHTDTKAENINKIFSKMDTDNDGKKVLNLLGVDKLVVLSKNNLYNMGGIK